MCSLCGHYPCHPRCPYSDEEEAILHCCNCDESLYENDEYYSIDDKDFCEDCFIDYAKSKYLRLAERNNVFDGCDF